jgi:adenylate cyclase
MAVAYSVLPLLHRFGSLVAPLVMIGLGYTWAISITTLVGTESGISYFILVGAAGGILLVGVDRVFVSVAIGAVAAAGIVWLHFMAPRAAPNVPMDSSFVMNVIGSSALLYSIVFYAVRQLSRAEASAERERQRSDSLLLNILPAVIAERLKDDPNATIADAHPEASVLFADMAGFTARSSDTPPDELVGFLNRVYTELDRLVEQHGLEKIKTTGDEYMVVSGVPEPIPDHAGAIAGLALDMRGSLAGLVDPKGRPVPVRIGIASGAVVAGVVGTRKLFYDVWGDTVNTASRMESTGEPGRIQIAGATRNLLEGRYTLEPRGTVQVPGKGPMETWFLKERVDQTTRPLMPTG